MTIDVASPDEKVDLPSVDPIQIGTDGDGATPNEITIGDSASGNDDSVVVGQGASASVTGAIAIGQGTQVDTQGVGRIGANSVIVGATSLPSDSVLNSEEAVIGVDSTNGVIELKAKQDDGTVILNELGAGGFDEQQDPLDIGDGATATGSGAISFGVSATSDTGGEDASPIAIGENADAQTGITSNSGGIAIGQGTTADSEGISIGAQSNTTTNDPRGIAIGTDVGAYFDDVLIGANAEFTGGNAGKIGIGSQANVTSGGSSSPGEAPISIGYRATTRNDDSVAVGGDSDVRGPASVGVGSGAVVDEAACVGVGNNVSVQSGSNLSVAIGYESVVSGVQNAVVIGAEGSVATGGVGRMATSQFVFGGTRDTIADADIDNGELTVELDETNGAFRLRGKDSGGTIREATIAW